MTVLKHMGSTNWYFRFSINGFVFFGSTHTANKTQAHKFELKMRTKAVNEQHFGLKKQITIESALTQFHDAQPDSASKANNNTYVRKLLGKKHSSNTRHGKDIGIFGFDGDRELHSLSTSDVQQLISSRQKEGNSSATIKLELTQLKQSIEYWSRLNHATPSIDFRELKKSNKLKISKGKMRYLTKDEEVALLAELSPSQGKNELEKSQKQDTIDLVTLLLDTGARYTEIAGLKWADVDLDTKTISLYRPKVRNQSILHLTNRAEQVLNRRYDASGGIHVFTNKNGDERNYSPRSFKSAVRRAKLENVTIHTLRKTFCSRLVQAGVPLLDVSRLAGHANITTTVNHYAFLAPNTGAMAARDVLNALNGVK